MFREFAEFVALHYILSHRNDTEYWKHIQEKSQLREGNRVMLRLAKARFHDHNFGDIGGGIHAIAAGMHYSPTELSEMMWLIGMDKESLKKQWIPCIQNMNTRKNNWEHAAKKSDNTYDFLKSNIHD
jgi:hypothetical protein